MSSGGVREFTPLFSWGFSLKPSRWLIPLFQNNVVNFGQSAVSGPYGWRNRSSLTDTDSKSGTLTAAQQIRQHHTLLTKSTTIISTQKRETHTQARVEENNVKPIISTLKSNTQKSSGAPKSQGNSSEQNNTPSKSRLSNQEIQALTDGEILDRLERGEFGHYKLEEVLDDTARAVKIRRMYLAGRTASTQTLEMQNAITDLPYENYDYDQVFGQCCENVVGYVPIPVGVVGPVVIDGKKYHIPMATTEGCLIASAQRGAKALSYNGINSVLLDDGMTRGPVVAMPSAQQAQKIKQWIENEPNYQRIETAFNSTSRFARLKEIKIAIAGRNIFLRFKCKTGDAMGMNMISKGVTKALVTLAEEFPQMKVVSVSGNFCTDKKSAAINWIEGRGKSIVVDAVIPKDVVQSVLKTNIDALVELNQTKNLIGSAMAGSVGGFNAHASNLVTAIFLACGQDAAQNVESSNCMTLMEKTKDGDLYMSCTMPSIEVGTVGGGTTLKPQAACLNMLGVKGAHTEVPGKNAQQLARIVASGVMCGELSLMSALATGSLVESHLKFNRKK